jgi:hypothetical protein
LDFALRPLVGGPVTSQDRRWRIVLFLLWLALIFWFESSHTFWRDEVRAFSLALSGSNYAEMLRNVHGEGHPALWYLVLRAGHDIFPYREVLPAAGLVIGIAAMAVLTFLAPFRTIIIAAVLFSFYGAFEYIVVARNYGISALVMFALAALYGRVRDSLWFGVILLILCNTNVPSTLLAAAFLLFRFVEMLAEGSRPAKRDWLVFAGNALLALFGAYLCFRAVYPTFNDAAVSPNLARLSALTVLKGLVDPGGWGFSWLGLHPNPGGLPDWVLLAVCCLGFIRRPAALAAGLAALIALKLFFFFVYWSYYRHEVLYLLFLLTLFWMVADGWGGSWKHRKWHDNAGFVGAGVFVGLLVLQAGRLTNPVREQLSGIPFSRSADVGKLLQRPELAGAIVMADPDTMLEPLPYYVDNPIYFLRQQRFGKVVRLARNSRHELHMDDILADAERLHSRTGRPIVFLANLKLDDRRKRKFHVLFRDATVLEPEQVQRFKASTRLIARLRPAGLDEDYDVYVYPR